MEAPINQIFLPKMINWVLASRILGIEKWMQNKGFIGSRLNLGYFSAF